VGPRQGQREIEGAVMQDAKGPGSANTPPESGHQYTWLIEQM